MNSKRTGKRNNFNFKRKGINNKKRFNNRINRNNVINTNAKKSRKQAILNKNDAATQKKVDQLVRAVDNMRLNLSRKNQPPRRINQVANNINKNKAKKIRNWIYALMHPEVIFRRGLLIKQPSMLTVPSAVVSFMESVTIEAVSAAPIRIRWVPNFLMSTRTTGKKNYCHMHYQTQNTGNATPYQSKPFPINFTSYRAVSAKMEIIYTGTPLSRSGIIAGCMTTVDNTVFLYADQHDPLISLSSHTVEEISNGIWAKKTGLKQGLCMSFLWLPMDATDNIFYPNGNFYGNDKVTSTDTIDTIASTEGVHSSYYAIIEGLTGAEKVTVNVYYVYEIVPTLETARVLRTTSALSDINIVNAINYKINSLKSGGEYIKA